MSETDATKQKPERLDRRWAVARIVLGQAQIVAAVIGLVMLIANGLRGPTLTAVVIAGLLVVASKLVFRKK